MRFKTLLLVGFMATSAVAGVVDTNHSAFICGTSSPSEDYLNISNARTQEDATSKIGKGPVNINVYVHVVAVNNSPDGGNVPDNQITAQVNVMNKHCYRYGLNFTLAAIDRSINTEWSRNTNEAQVKQMKTALHRGGAADLNVYIMTEILGNEPAEPGTILTGKATFPWHYMERPWADGISIHYTTLPGGPHPDNSEGIAAVHEVGHWFGLLHTFEGGCLAPGDFISDTPPQQSASSGCPVGRDTCSQPGLDSIHNYMDYSNDHCRTEFTAGQVIRMGQAASMFRGI